MAYGILASFNSLAYHLYSIIYKDRKYKCYIVDDLMFDDEIVLDASQSILSALKNKNILRRIGSSKNGWWELI